MWKLKIFVSTFALIFLASPFSHAKEFTIKCCVDRSVPKSCFMWLTINTTKKTATDWRTKGTFDLTIEPSKYIILDGYTDNTETKRMHWYIDRVTGEFVREMIKNHVTEKTGRSACYSAKKPKVKF